MGKNKGSERAQTNRGSERGGKRGEKKSLRSVWNGELEKEGESRKGALETTKRKTKEKERKK